MILNDDIETIVLLPLRKVFPFYGVLTAGAAARQRSILGCLSVCQHVYGKTTGPIFMKLERV